MENASFSISSDRAHCPALLVAAPGSNQGKTTVTAAIARYHRNAGHVVKVFKIGPDYLDPMILERASGNPVEQLDLWMVGEAECRNLIAEAAQTSDLILFEGVMGLFDGSPSSADLAQTFGIPILLVVDASGMAQSFGALASGFTRYRPELTFAGVLANRVGSAGHGTYLSDSLIDGTPYLGHVLKDENVTLPDRHLGLVQATEITDIEERLNRAAGQIGETQLAELPVAVEFDLPRTASTPLALPQLLEGKTIAYAKDAAFGFIYDANLRCLKSMGATLVAFSPMADQKLPNADAIWLPGGYPELHMDVLSTNHSLHANLKSAHESGIPIFAECGGLLYLQQSLEDTSGAKAEMVGLLPGAGKMQKKLSSIGMQFITTSEGKLRGHTFHYSQLETLQEVCTRATSVRFKRPGEAIYTQGNLIASYVHLYFPSNPVAAAKLFLRGNREGFFSCD